MFWKKPKYVYNIFAQFPQMPVFCQLILSTGFKNKTIATATIDKKRLIKRWFLNMFMSICCNTYQVKQH